MEKLYLLHFVHEFEDGHENVILLGIFSSEDEAKTSLAQLRQKPALSRCSDKFVISKTTLDKLSWEEGYTTVEY